jgi:hypothetical protein
MSTSIMTYPLLDMFAETLIDRHEISRQLIEDSRTNYRGTRPGEVSDFDAADGALFAFALAFTNTLDAGILGSISGSVASEQWGNASVVFHGCPSRPMDYLRYLAANVLCWRIDQLVN